MYESEPFEGYYAFICTDSENSAEKRQQVRNLHVARLKELRKEGRLLLAGPFLDSQDLSKPIGGLIIAKFNSLEEAQNWLTTHLTQAQLFLSKFLTLERPFGWPL